MESNTLLPGERVGGLMCWLPLSFYRDHRPHFETEKPARIPVRPHRYTFTVGRSCDALMDRTA